MTKQAPKTLVDKLIRLRRKYWKTGDIDLFPAIEKVEKELSVAIFGNEDKWSVSTAIIDLGIEEPSTAAIQNATNAQIYAIFNACGIDVVGAEETKPEEKFGEFEQDEDFIQRFLNDPDRDNNDEKIEIRQQETSVETNGQ
jgi:hypothetical protein